jgi:hypothetical protein
MVAVIESLVATPRWLAQPAATLAAASIRHTRAP